jgi:hypothetical protein
MERGVHMTTEQTRFPTGQHGQFKLTDWVIGLVDDPALAARCVQALEARGVAPDDILLVPGQSAQEQADQESTRVHSGGIFTRLLAALEESREGDEEIRQAYLHEAEQGHIFLGVHLTDADQMDLLRNLLIDHHVHTIAYFQPALVQRLG